MSDIVLKLDHVSKSYPGGTQALVDIDLEVIAGEILCLLGPSGCGKTTLLRVVAGLETPERGRVFFQGRDLATVPTHRRGFGFMFQDFALFPHRTVAQNIEFGLRMAKAPRQVRAERVEAMLELVNLPSYGKRTIFELSGGERQRVALARSLAPNPALLMLDEPLGSLDRGLREELVEELHSILKQMGVTALYVTHDQDEAMALGDRIVVIRRGRIEQIGVSREVYTQPASPFVARFLGYTNLIPAQRTEGGVDTPLGYVPLSNMPPSNLPATEALTLLLRPEAARLAQTTHSEYEGFQSTEEDAELVHLHGHLNAATYHGDNYRIEVTVRPKSNEAGEPYTLRFVLPTYQRIGHAVRLEPVQLPAIGAPITLLIATNLTTLLPYASDSPA